MAVISSSEQTYLSHDLLFKEFLHRFLPQFMAIFFAEIAAQLDFSTLKFLDQELITNLPDQEKHIADVAAEVQTLTGEIRTIVVHIEVEAYADKTLNKRMFEYYALRRVVKQQHVLPIALILLRGGTAKRWASYRESLFGEQFLTFRYGQVSLPKLTSEDYLNLNDPVAATLAALMKPKELEELELYLKSWQTIQASNLSLGDQDFLFNVVENYLRSVKLRKRRGEEMPVAHQLEETFIERLWREKREAIAEVRAEAARAALQNKREIILRLSRVKFGAVDKVFKDKIGAVNDMALLDKMNERMLSAESPQDILDLISE